jgi:hypothetical protein
MVPLIYLHFVSVSPSIAKMVVLHKAFPPITTILCGIVKNSYLAKNEPGMNQHPREHHAGWMICGHQILFHCVFQHHSLTIVVRYASTTHVTLLVTTKCLTYPHRNESLIANLGSALLRTTSDDQLFSYFFIFSYDFQ